MPASNENKAFHKYQLTLTAMARLKIIHIAVYTHKPRFYLITTRKYQAKPATKLKQSKKPSLQLTIRLIL